MEYNLSMTFLTELGLKASLNVSGIKPNLTKEEINSLMDTIIQKDIFAAKSGKFIKKSGAQITQRQVTKFEVA